MKKLLRAAALFLKKADVFLLILCLACAVYGTVLISSAAGSYGSGHYLAVQISAIVIGVALFMLFTLVDLDIIADKWFWLLLFNIAFISTLFVWGRAGDTVNRGWLRFGPIGIQPSEIVKVTFIIITAKLMNAMRRRRRLNSFVSLFLLALHFLLIFALILVASSDLGSAMVYFFIFVLMLFGGGIKLRWFAIGAALTAAAVPLAWKYVLKPYQKLRIIAPYDPSVDPTGLDVLWHTNQSRAAITGGGLTGQGLGHGYLSQSEYLPGKHTDFIFAVAGEELGLIGCIVIIVLLTAVIVRCIYIGVRSNDYLYTVACFGIAGMMICQTFENIGMCLGLTPVIGITLPFFSYGGSSIISLFSAMGIVSGARMHRAPDRTAATYY